jgi:hypothetical protein
LAKLDFATWLETRTPKQLKELADEIRKATQEKPAKKAKTNLKKQLEEA